MNSRIKNNQTTLIFYVTLFLALTVSIATSNAQSFNKNKKVYYKGIDGGFGIHTFQMNSDISAIDKSTVSLAGGKLGVVLGNTIVRTKIAFGYYASTTGIAGSVDLYRNTASVNFYPLNALTKKNSRVEPYFTAGVAYNNIKMYGHYLGNDNGKQNYSVSQAPYLGSIKQVNGTIGAGIEVKLMEKNDFVHLTSEVVWGGNIFHNQNETFQNSSVNKQMTFNVGISFGVRN
jgi:hypothetical protein